MGRVCGLTMRYDIGYMFQNNALVDDYTVKENPNIVLKYSRFNKKEKVNAVKQALTTVGLEGYENRKIYSYLVEKPSVSHFVSCFLKSQRLCYAMNQLVHLMKQTQK